MVNRFCINPGPESGVAGNYRLIFALATGETTGRADPKTGSRIHRPDSGKTTAGMIATGSAKCAIEDSRFGGSREHGK
jgi:hypothetical protein